MKWEYLTDRNTHGRQREAHDRFPLISENLERQVHMYRVTINTDNFKGLSYSKRNWERGQINDFMHAINGWEAIENDIVELGWRLGFFLSGKSPSERYDKRHENHVKALLWDESPNNSVTYHVRALGEQRISQVQAWGIAQGYISPAKIMDKLHSKGEAIIDFSEAYDTRQNGRKVFKGAYMKIEKVA